MPQIALIEPEIPPNTGNIGRFCAAMRCPLHLIGPLGFSLDEKHLRRAGMDYWDQVDFTLWPSSELFFKHLSETGCRFYLFTTKVKRAYTQVVYEEGDMLVFGRESKGLPESLLASHPEHCLTIPMVNPLARSLNLSTAATIVASEVLRQIRSRSK